MYYTLFIWYEYQLRYKKADTVYTFNSEIAYHIWCLHASYTIIIHTFQKR
jgi:hypothetical protein